MSSKILFRPESDFPFVGIEEPAASCVCLVVLAFFIAFSFGQ